MQAAHALRSIRSCPHMSSIMQLASSALEGAVPYAALKA